MRAVKQLPRALPKFIDLCLERRALARVGDALYVDGSLVRQVVKHIVCRDGFLAALLVPEGEGMRVMQVMVRCLAPSKHGARRTHTQSQSHTHAPKNEVNPVMQVCRHIRALERVAVLGQKVIGAGSPWRQLHVADDAPVLALAQRQVFAVD